MNTKEMRGKDAAELKQELESLLRAQFCIAYAGGHPAVEQDCRPGQVASRYRTGQDHYAREGGSSMTEIKKMVTRTLTGVW
jgi:hypothetical protein